MVIADDYSNLRHCDVMSLLMVNGCHGADLPDDHWKGFSHTRDTTVFFVSSNNSRPENNLQQKIPEYP
ncbi:MAG: hypothetical protein ACI9XK_003756 [Granulosicoccus sp.]|jgi:hypothetical protein